MCVLVFAGLVPAAAQQHKNVKHHKKHKAAVQQPVKQTPEQRKELLQKTLKEKNFHMPDSSRH
jgi:hypothetical protein